MERRPYVGVTGFMTRSEVESVLDVVPRGTNRLLMVGVLASLKATLLGQESSRPNRYPKKENLVKIFGRDPNTLNLVHYNSKETETLYDQLSEIRALAGHWCDGFQLNMPWPDLLVLAKFAVKARRTIVVLQVGKRAFEMVNNDPDSLVDRLAEYENFVDYVLLDPSGGGGIPFDADKARRYLEAIKSRGLDIGLGLAGGLNSSNLNRIGQFLHDFPALSWDAEGKLRDKDDNMDIVETKKYGRNSFEMGSNANERG